MTRDESLTIPLDRMTADQHPWLAAAARDDFFASLPWYRTLAVHGLGAAQEPVPAPTGANRFRITLSGSPGARAAMALEAVPGAGGLFAARHLRSLTNFYSCRYTPILESDERLDALDPLIGGLVAEKPAWDVVTLDSLDRDSAAFACLSGAFMRRGWPVQTYFHFGNWFETTEGVSPNDYFAARPGNLRSTLKRQGSKLHKSAAAEFRLLRQSTEVDEAIALYESVYQRSWKGSEPYPAFAGALIRATAALGCLRLGVLLIDGEPAAAQLWIVWHGKATIFKLAHDERHTALSPGSLLTRFVMDQVLAEGGIREVDFGRGDDSYKRLWLPQRRERWGLMAFNPRTLRGGLLALRHIGGGAAKRMARRIQAKLAR